jgi:hypothetical protein
VPLVGETVNFGLTLKVVLADQLPAVTFTVCVPTVLAGTVKITPEKLPEPFVLGEAGLVVCVTPSYFTLIALDGGKPVPDTVIASPTCPLEAETEPPLSVIDVLPTAALPVPVPLLVK